MDSWLEARSKSHDSKALLQAAVSQAMTPGAGNQPDAVKAR